MKSFRDYLIESETWADCPREGDEFDIELAPDELIESRVLESDGETIVLEATAEIIAMMEQRGLVAERIARYGPVGSNQSQGFTVEEEQPADEQEIEEDRSLDRVLELAGYRSKMEEDQSASIVTQKELATDIANPMPEVHEGVMKSIAAELQEIANTEDYDRLYDLMTSTSPTGEMVQKIADEISINHHLYDDDHEELLELVMDRLIDDFGGDELDEAEYQGRKVPLGKPMRGDVKKFKVYVKDPKTGNVKKVNFGHGGTSAKRARQKTMKIKKSNPARRKSFRARHRCDTAKDRTTARYWSCRAW